MRGRGEREEGSDNILDKYNSDIESQSDDSKDMANTGQLLCQFLFYHNSPAASP